MPFIHSTTVSATGCSWQASSWGCVRQEVHILHRNKLHWADFLLSAAEKFKEHSLGQQLNHAVRCLLQVIDASVSRAVQLCSTAGGTGLDPQPSYGGSTALSFSSFLDLCVAGKGQTFRKEKKGENASLIDYFAKVVENCSCPLHIYSGSRGTERFSEEVR